MISQRICTLNDSCFAVVEVNGWADSRSIISIFVTDNKVT